MKVLVVISLIAAAVTASPNRNVIPVKDALGVPSKIISGSPAAPGDFPWQVSNQFTTFFGQSFCGGSLIDARWVLTAGHCADGALSFKITLGNIYSDGRPEAGAVTITTTDAIVHPEYDSWFITNDLALINLNSQVGLTQNIKIVGLGTDQIGAGIPLVVSGWGKTSDASNVVSTNLNFVGINTISNDECRGVYGSSINAGSLCCRGNPEQSTCNGDSGGPLVQIVNGVASHAGVVSFVHVAGCASGNPSGYARTSYYRSWILQTIGQK